MWAFVVAIYKQPIVPTENGSEEYFSRNENLFLGLSMFLYPSVYAMLAIAAASNTVYQKFITSVDISWIIAFMLIVTYSLPLLIMQGHLENIPVHETTALGGE